MYFKPEVGSISGPQCILYDCLWAHIVSVKRSFPAGIRWEVWDTLDRSGKSCNPKIGMETEGSNSCKGVSGFLLWSIHRNKGNTGKRNVWVVLLHYFSFSAELQTVSSSALLMSAELTGRKIFHFLKCLLFLLARMDWLVVFHLYAAGWNRKLTLFSSKHF